MPKIPEISVGIQMERSVSVFSDRNIRDHLLRWSTPLSSAEVQAFVISIRCAKCTAGTKSNGSIRRRLGSRAFRRRL